MVRKDGFTTGRRVDIRRHQLPHSGRPAPRLVFWIIGVDATTGHSSLYLRSDSRIDGSTPNISFTGLYSAPRKARYHLAVRLRGARSFTHLDADKAHPTSISTHGYITFYIQPTRVRSSPSSQTDISPRLIAFSTSVSLQNFYSPTFSTKLPGYNTDCLRRWKQGKAATMDQRG